MTSLISGCGILSFGCGLSIYHGFTGLLHPTELEPLNYVSFLTLSLFIYLGILRIGNVAVLPRKLLEDSVQGGHEEGSG